MNDTYQMSRRDFLSRRGIGQLLEKVAPMLGMEGEAAAVSLAADSTIGKEEIITERKVMDGYFSSPLYSYALLSEMPWDMLIEEARQRNIPCEGRTKLEVVKDLFLGQEERASGMR